MSHPCKHIAIAERCNSYASLLSSSMEANMELSWQLMCRCPCSMRLNLSLAVYSCRHVVKLHCHGVLLSPASMLEVIRFDLLLCSVSSTALALDPLNQYRAFLHHIAYWVLCLCMPTQDVKTLLAARPGDSALLKLQDVLRQRFQQQLQQLKEKREAEERQQQQEGEAQQEQGAEVLDQQQQVLLSQEQQQGAGLPSTGSGRAPTDGKAAAGAALGDGTATAVTAAATPTAAGDGGSGSEVLPGIKVVPMVIEDTDGSDSDPDSPRWEVAARSGSGDVGTAEMPALEDLVMASSLSSSPLLQPEQQQVKVEEEQSEPEGFGPSQAAASGSVAGVGPTPVQGDVLHTPGSSNNNEGTGATSSNSSSRVGVDMAAGEASASSSSGGSSPSSSGRQQSKKEQVAAAAAALSLKRLSQLDFKKQQQPRGPEEFLKTCKALQRAAVGGASSSSGVAKAASGQPYPLVQYLASIPPKSYGSVFKVGLNAEAIGLLVGAWQSLAEEEPRFVVESMEALSKVSRFGMCMGMASTDKGVVKGLQGVMQQLEESGVNSSRVGEFRKLYMVK